MNTNLPIDIEKLLDGKTLESNRLEFKEGWNPDAIYRTICAFANDFEDTGGGYILVGVKEVDGCAVRPIVGIDTEKIESIEKEMIGFNNLIQPFYQPRLFIENVDGKNILVIKVTAGERRPYKVPDNITAKHKSFNFYIRYNSSSIIPKNEYEEELRNLANRVPFDDRGNKSIALDDISTSLLRDYLVEVNSSLSHEDMSGDRLMNVLDQMDLLENTSDMPLIRNVAAMMFCDHPYKFYKYSHVEIVIFPNGRERDPNNMIEIPIIRGSVPKMITDTMNFLKLNVIKKKIHKQKFDEHSEIVYNYPYQALEESVVNSLYHRNYQDQEPVEITIEPHRISILSFGGPNHTISNEAIREAKVLRSRRYTNRRLGEFLKELNLTEGRSTGIPTIQDELQRNGSPRAIIETNDERSYFLIDIPCHPEFSKETFEFNKQNNEPKNDPKELSERQLFMLDCIRRNETITRHELTRKIKVSEATIKRELAFLQQRNILRREGGRKDGHWIVED